MGRPQKDLTAEEVKVLTKCWEQTGHNIERARFLYGFIQKRKPPAWETMRRWLRLAGLIG